MVTGKVKWFDSKKGYGFIEQASGDDIFVHYKEINAEGHRSLHQDDQVEFTLSEGQKGLQALNVSVLEKA